MECAVSGCHNKAFLYLFVTCHTSPFFFKTKITLIFYFLISEFSLGKVISNADWKKKQYDYTLGNTFKELLKEEIRNGIALPIFTWFPVKCSWKLGITLLECISRFYWNEFQTWSKFCCHWVHNSATSSQNVWGSLLPPFSQHSATAICTIQSSHYSAIPTRYLPIFSPILLLKATQYIILYAWLWHQWFLTFQFKTRTLKTLSQDRRTSQRLFTLWILDKTIFMMGLPQWR